MLPEKTMGQATSPGWLKESSKHIEILHKDSKGWITLATINDGHYKQWHYKYKNILDFIEETNCFISQNTFYSTYRRIEYIKELKTLYIDLDYYHICDSFSIEWRRDAVLYALENDFFKIEIPEPNLIIDSGRGLYLIWRIESIPSQALPLYNFTQRYFYEKLKELGADKNALDCTRILRLAGTINSKVNKPVRILELNDYVYDIHNIQKEYLPEIVKKASGKGESKKDAPKKPLHLFNEYTLYYARIQDLISLCELRNWDLKGHREVILFLYRYWNCCFIGDKEDALRQVLELNSQFVEPLRETEVKNATRSAEKVYLTKDKEYKYKNQTLIELLEITENEEKKLRSIIGKDEKKLRNNKQHRDKRRSNDGLTSKQQELKKLRLKIQELEEKGLTQKQISFNLNISKRKIIRLLKQ